MSQAARRRLIGLSSRSNALVARILRSRFHWLLSGGLLLLTVTGRRSGRRYTIPVGYHETDEAIVVFVGEPSTKTWWRNYQTPGPVELLCRSRRVAGTAQVVASDDTDYRRLAETVFRRSGMVSRIFDLRFDASKGLSPEQVQELAKHLGIVRIPRTK
jgi:deazaflavin-dependent oxidoreductase (nitroreductase family)